MRKPLPKAYNQALGEAMAYLVQSQQMPELMGSDDNIAKGAKWGAPTLQLMRTIGLSKLNYSPSEIMDALFGQLMWDIITFNEVNGGAKIIHGALADGLANLKQRQQKAQVES